MTSSTSIGAPSAAPSAAAAALAGAANGSCDRTRRWERIERHGAVTGRLKRTPGLTWPKSSSYSICAFFIMPPSP
eukprot:2706262-Prymnesium_polylepis.1